MAYDPIERQKRYQREKMQKSNEPQTPPIPSTIPATTEPATAVNAGDLVKPAEAASKPEPAQGLEPATPVSAGSLVEGTPGNAPELPLGNISSAPPVSDPQPEKRKPGRPKGSRNSPKPGFGDVESIAAVAAEPPQPPVDYQAMSGAMFDLSTGLLAGTLGTEWSARSPEERLSVVAPLAVYMQSKEMRDLPPGFILAIAITVYAMPRVKTPTTAGKLKNGWQWLRNKFKRKKGTIAMLPPSTLETENHEQGN